MKGETTAYPMAYKYQIDLNAIPQIDVFFREWLYQRRNENGE